MSVPVPEKRVADFENKGFGMFIHWGLYSQMGKGEWVQHIHGIPMTEYQKLQSTFTASEFDARHIVSVAKAAGARPTGGFAHYYLRDAGENGCASYVDPKGEVKKDLGLTSEITGARVCVVVDLGAAS